MSLEQMSIAYSPTSPVLEDIIFRSSLSLLALNIIPIIRWILAMRPELVPSDIIDNLPPEIMGKSSDFDNDTDINNFLRRLIKIDAYNNSDGLKNLYQNETNIRVVIAAVQFDDSLYGKYFIVIIKVVAKYILNTLLVKNEN